MLNAKYLAGVPEFVLSENYCNKPASLITLKPCMFLCPCDFLKSLAGITPSVVLFMSSYFVHRKSSPGNYKVSTNYVFSHLASCVNDNV